MTTRRTPFARARRAWSAVWDEPPPADPPLRVWRDWALVGALVPAVVIEGMVRPDLPGRWLQVAAALLLIPTLLWRRTHPLLPVVATTVVTTVVMLVMGRTGDLVTAVFGVVLIYALFRWGSGRNIVVGAGLLAVALGLPWALGHDTGGDALGGASVVAALGATGLAVRFRAAARQRALAQARSQERERIARDMHDVVGHHVSGIAVRAQAGLAQAAARRGRSDGGDGGDPLEAALRVIETEAKDTLVEMRALVRTLREDEPGADGPVTPDPVTPDPVTPDPVTPDPVTPDPVTPDPVTPDPVTPDPVTPGNRPVEHGPQAADVVRLAAGPPSPVIVTVRGEVGGVRADVGAAAYRIAQESVTNARRHAPGRTRVEVALTVGAEVLRLRVWDDGGPPSSPFAPGNGIAGMQVRARELGGDVTAGPEPAGGWAVAAVLPLTGGRS
ncbi:sensor histidine kinase [Promicromonospora umidemergens]|uniref:sensor histidine kinase n=1 Tax=Promicromonospora umidemergens TaxID=629679 RepID=UPI0031EE7575